MPLTYAGAAPLIVVLVLASGCSDHTTPDSRASTPGVTSPQDVETEIRRLEQLEVEAVLAKDVATLETLWDPQFVVHNPEHQIVRATANPADRPVMQAARTAFTRDVEHVTIRPDVVISMGSETVVPAGDLPQSGETVRRRYTNIWMKVGDSWKLIARHANVVPPSR